MIDAKLRAAIRMALRSVSFRMPSRIEALKKQETATEAFKKDGTKKERKGKQTYTRRYKCEVCNKDGFKSTEVRVDHIIPAGYSPESRDAAKGWTWQHLIDRLFCSPDNLQVICLPCHENKTLRDREEIRNGTFEKYVDKHYPICEHCGERSTKFKE